MNYWINKEERAEKAMAHTKDVADRYKNEIKNCINNSIVYGLPDREPVQVKRKKGAPVFELLNTDSVSAIFAETGKMAVLNFASYKNPGGMFINGSSAQEESLCHESFLYNVLVKFDDYYEWNNKHKNRALYMDRAIYSPCVIFERAGVSKICDVITCAAPNKGAARRWQHVTNEENTKVFTERIQFIKEIAEEQKVDTLILGAYGAGVFKQDAKEVAEIIKMIFSQTTVPRVVLAVPGNDKNYQAFCEVF